MICNKSVLSNVFWYVKVRIFWKSIQYIIYWDKTQTLREFSWGKMSGTKNALFFLLRATANHSFTFNLRFLYVLKHKIHLSTTACCIFYFRFFFVFIKFYIFFQTKCMDFMTLNRHNFFQNNKNSKATLSFPHRPLILKLPKEILKWYLHILELPKTWPSYKFFNPSKIEVLRTSTFSQ